MEKALRSSARWMDVYHHKDAWAFLMHSCSTDSTLHSVVVTDDDNATPIEKIDWANQPQPWTFIVGNEERGVSPLVRMNSVSVRLPMEGMSRVVSSSVHLSACLMYLHHHNLLGTEQVTFYFPLRLLLFLPLVRLLPHLPSAAFAPWAPRLSLLPLGVYASWNESVLCCSIPLALQA